MPGRCLLALIVLLGSSLLSGCADPEPDAAPLPNILWITVEDMSARLAPYGDSLAATPTINRLANEGVVYTNVFVASPVCAPNRTAMITGMYPTTIGAQHMRTRRRTSALDDITDPELLAIPTYEAVPPPEVKVFTESLRAQGYYTTNNVKTDYQFTPPVTGWDESSNEAHWRNRPDPDQPFFSVFNFTTTHESQVWSRAGEPWLIDTTAIELPPYYPDTPIVRRDFARHYNNIQVMDGQVAEIIQQLEADELMDETIIFFFSDHGDGLPRAKRWLYDSGLHIPFIVRWPDGRDAGTHDDRLVSSIDFAPSLLSLAGIPIPDYMQGPAFLGPQAGPPRDYVYAVKGRMDPALDNARAVRDDRFKYIRNLHPDRPFVQFLPYRDRMGLMQELHRLHEAGELDSIQALWFRDTKPVEELYDTAIDPHEIHNLADDPAYQDKLVELRTQYEQWKEETDDWGVTPETEMIKQMWPPDGVQPTTEPVQFTAADTVFTDAVTVTLQSPTEGASIAYRPAGTERWRLYHEPLRVDSTVTLEAQAIRLGWKHSPVTTIRLVRQQGV